MRCAASIATATKRHIDSLTCTRRRGVAFKNDSSLSGSKRLKRSCQSSSRARVATAARSPPSPSTWMPASPPKQGNEICDSVGGLTVGDATCRRIGPRPPSKLKRT